MSAKAMVVTTKIDSRTNRMSLKSGEKGTGKTLWSGQYWPNSGTSVEAIEAMMADAAERLGVEVVWPELNGDF